MKKSLAWVLALIMTASCMVGLIMPAAAVAPAGKAIDVYRVNNTGVSVTNMSMTQGDIFSMRGWLVPTNGATANKLTKMAYSTDGGVTVTETAVATGGFFAAEQAVLDAGGYTGSTADGNGNFRIDTPLSFMSTLAVGTYTVNVYIYDANNIRYDWSAFSITIKAPTGEKNPIGRSLDAYAIDGIETAGDNKLEFSITIIKGATLSIRGWVAPTNGATANKLTKLAYSNDGGNTLTDIAAENVVFSVGVDVNAAVGYTGSITEGNGNFRISASLPFVTSLAIGNHTVIIYAYDNNGDFYKWATYNISVENNIEECVYIPLGAEKPHQNVAIEGHNGYLTYEVTGAADPFYYIAHNEVYAGTDHRYFVFHYRTTTVTNIKILAETSAGAPTISTNLVADGKWHVAMLDKNTFSVPVNSSTISTGGYRFGFADMPVGATIDVADFSIGNYLYTEVVKKVPDIAAASLVLTSDIGMNWYYPNEYGLTVQLKVTNAAGTTATIGADPATVNGREMFKFSYPDIAAKEIGENLRVVLEVLKDNGNGLQPVAKSIWFDYSPAQYCKDVIASNDYTAQEKTLCADLLNYAAEAQKYFGYKTDELVTTGAVLDNATDSITPPDSLLVTPAAGATVKNISNALILNNKIEVRFDFDGIPNIEYAVHVGNEIYNVTSDVYGNFYVVYKGLDATDVIAPINYAVYRYEDNVSGDYTYSISTYIARKWDNSASGNLVQAMWKYCSSARTLFAEAMNH